MTTENAVGKETIAHGFPSLHCPDSLTENLYNMGCEASVSFRIESENDTITTIWLENPLTGRVMDVEVVGSAEHLHAGIARHGD